MKRAQTRERSSTIGIAGATALAALALALAGCGGVRARSGAEALAPCDSPGKSCQVHFENGDESACHRLRSGELDCWTMASAE